MNTTKKAQHTAGEWAVSFPMKEKEGGISLQVVSKDAIIADIKGYYSHGSEFQRANARLISASPDLLSACEHTLNVINGRILLKALCPDDGVLGIIKEMKDAIAKAKGE